MDQFLESYNLPKLPKVKQIEKWPKLLKRKLQTGKTEANKFILHVEDIVHVKISS